MKKWILPCAMLCCYQSVSAQLGVTLAPTSSSAPDWQVLVENFVTHRRTPFMSYGVTGLLDYHLPSHSPAWSFRPALHGMRTEFSYLQDQFEVVSLGLQGNVNFAPFLVGKDSTGRHVFYCQFSPGLSLVRQRYDQPIDEGGPVQDGMRRTSSLRMAANFGFNLLVEIHLTQLLSVAPQLGIRYYPGLEWPGFTALVSDGQLDGSFDRTDWKHLTFGLRIGLNLEAQ